MEASWREEQVVRSTEDAIAMERGGLGLGRRSPDRDREREREAEMGLEAM